MKFRLWPITVAGKWAASLTLLFIFLMCVKLLGSEISIRLPLPSPVIVLFGVAGFIFGFISIMKNKERAVLTVLSIPVGLLLILWMVAELIFPH